MKQFIYRNMILSYVNEVYASRDITWPSCLYLPRTNFVKYGYHMWILKSRQQRQGDTLWVPPLGGIGAPIRRSRFVCKTPAKLVRGPQKLQSSIFASWRMPDSLIFGTRKGPPKRAFSQTFVVSGNSRTLTPIS